MNNKVTNFGNKKNVEDLLKHFKALSLAVDKIQEKNCTAGQKKERNTPIYLNTNYTEIKLVYQSSWIIVYFSLMVQIFS